jgi:excisionase family DNA binding protein
MGDDVMTISEVACELRCSKAHVYNAINGKVNGVGRLPVITMGRRRLVRRSSLEWWKESNELGGPRDGILLPSPEVDAVGRA